ncbi:MAG: Na+/H+ antiporter, partial [Mycobacteriaceae bacterium]|nr:Na+/H+ antiporter [Mycobacteriaceae bacterium]
SRLQSFAFWDVTTFLLNGSLWVFVGVQIPNAMHGIANVQGGIRHATYLALIVTGVVIATRFAWVELTTVLGLAIDRTTNRPTRHVPFRQRSVTSCAGFRGAVSLAAALAVPLETHSGAPFPDRSLIIFVVSVVILVTVLVQGSTLPMVVRWARLPEDVARAEEVQLARTRGAEVALEALPEIAAEVDVGPKLLARLEKEYQEKALLAEADGDDSDDSNHLTEARDKIREVHLRVLERKRQAITELRNQRRIDDIVLREIQQTMDLEEVRLLGPADVE